MATFNHYKNQFLAAADLHRNNVSQFCLLYVVGVYPRAWLYWKAFEWFFLLQYFEKCGPEDNTWIWERNLKNTISQNCDFTAANYLYSMALWSDKITPQQSKLINRLPDESFDVEEY